MPWYSSVTPATGQVAIGSQLWFLPSYGTNASDCLVMAHGGFTQGGPTFTVPAGVTVHFYVRHGDTANDPQALVHVGTNTHSGLIGENVGPGRQCCNYSLSKVLGHGASGFDAQAGQSNYYHAIADMMEMAGLQERPGSRNWAPSVVSVRNRILQSRSVTLESVVTQVRGAYPGITDFYILACRAVFTAPTMFRGGRRVPIGSPIRV